MLQTVALPRPALLVALLAAALGPAAAGAASLAPGGSVFLPGTTLAETSALDGPVAANDDFAVDFNPEPLFYQGHEYQTEVRTSDATGGTIFSHRFAVPINIYPSFLYIDGFNLTGYAGFDLDVFLRVDGPGDRGPTSAGRSADGDVLEFLFGFPLVVGYLVQQTREASLPIEILTDADSFAYTGSLTVWGRISDEEGTETVEVTLFGLPVPVNVTTQPPPVPLPASAPLLAAAVAALAAFRRHRRAAG